MADVTTLTPEARQAILLHLQGGGDPAHAAAIASGAITPEIAQQLAMQNQSPLQPMQLSDMRTLAAQTSPLATPQLQLDPQLAQATGPAPDPAAAGPQIASSMPTVQPTSEQQRAENVIDDMASQGSELGQKSAALNMASVAQSAKARDAGIEAADAKKELDTVVNAKQREVLQKSNDQIASIDQQEYDALQQRQATMNKILGNMLTSANDAAQVAPHDFWYNRSTSSKIFAVISQIAGGAANGLANQPGQPTALDRIISSDLDQQRLAFAQKSQTNNQNSGIYNDLVKANESQTTAYGALRIAAYKRVLAQLQQAAIDDPSLKTKADYKVQVANVQQKLAETLQSASKQVGDQAVDLSKAAGTNATSLGTTEMKDKSAEKVANIEGGYKLATAKETDKAGKMPFMPTGVYVLPGHEAQANAGVPEKFQTIVYNTTTGYSSLQKEVADIDTIWKGPFDTAEKVKMIAEHQQAVARDLSKIYNAGNRVAGGAYDEMTGGIPPTLAAKLGKFLSEKLFFDDATLKSLKETVGSSENYANNALAPFGYSVTPPKAAN